MDNNTHEQQLLPPLIYLPFALGEFVSGEPRTCFELYQHVVKLAIGSNVGLTNDNIKLVKNFSMAACQVGTGAGNKDSMLMLKVGSTHSN